MLKKSTYLFLCLLLCIPLVLVIVFALSINIEKPTNTTLMSVGVVNRDGFSFSLSDSDELSLYLDAVSSSKKIEHPVRDISGVKATEVTYNELNTKQAYSFFMDKDVNECYYSDKNGELYRIDSQVATQLSLRKEHAYLFTDYIVPTLTLSTPDGSFLYAANEGYEWKYQQGDSFNDGFLIKSQEAQSISFGKDDEISLEFSNAPDTCEVTVYHNETAVHFANSVESIAQLPTKLSYEVDTPIVCKIDAKWHNAEDGSSYGSASYTINMLYDIPATYKVVDGKLSPGEFTIVKFENLNDDKGVTFVSEIPLPPTKIHSVNGKKFAFLPVDLKTKPGAYKINVIADGVESSFNFTVNNKSFPETQIAQQHGTSAYDNSKLEFEAILKQISEQSVAERLWDDNAATGGVYRFANPVSGGETVSPAFGTRVIADTNLRASTPYICPSIVIEADEGKDVCATAKGVVAYIGELAYCGKTVIIDHGCNVLSIYSNLSEVNARVGEIVEIRTPVGKTGKTGYTFTTGTRFSMLMDGIYINPVSNYTFGIQVS